MSMKESYETCLNKRRQLLQGEFGEVLYRPERRYVHPFRIYGNVWYVGDTWVCVHLIDTGEGLLLIDAGSTGGTAMLVHAIWEAGFDPSEVKWIVLSHGHFDHICGAAFFQSMFGTKIYIGEPDADMFEERPELALMQDTGNVWDEIPRVDVRISDNETYTFGNTTMQFYLVPGHTEGCVAAFFDAYEGGEKKRCGYYGGFGFNTLSDGYLDEIGDKARTMRRKYLASLDKVKEERVDIFLGNHCDNNDVLNKRKYQAEHPGEKNPFIDPAEWKTYLNRKEKELLSM